MSVRQDAMTIVKEITIEAPASEVFEALTDPQELAQWWGDESYRLVRVEADVRVGGPWRIVGARSNGETFVVAGAYRTVEAPSLLEYSWGHQGEDSEITTVRFELSERAGSTHLRLIHSGFETEQSRDDHESGWALVIAWLKEFVETH